MSPKELSTRAEQYRALAAECEKRANQVQVLESKRSFLELARGWRELAEQYDKVRTW
jgi:hypothetical protein